MRTTVYIYRKMLRNTLKLSKRFCERSYSSTVDELVAYRRNDTAIIQFNRPKKLNAMSVQTQMSLSKHLRDFENDSSVSAVILKGNDAGFCVGGDVIEFSKYILESDTSRKHFYDVQLIFYRALLRVAEYKKPVIALADGICMGGGAGYTFLSSHPVITERTVFAMPEVFIGFFPNVAANYFLTKLANNIGMWIGLTGKRLLGPEIVKVGLSNNYIKSSNMGKLEDALVSLNDVNHESVSKTIERFLETPDFSTWNVDVPTIERLFDGSSVEQIVDNLKEDKSEFSSKILQLFLTLSPTALKITFNLFRQSQMRKYNLNNAISADFTIYKNFYGEPDANMNDFREGIRSVLVDKNHRPNWIPNRLDQVDDDKVISYFTNNIVDIRSSDP